MRGRRKNEQWRAGGGGVILANGGMNRINSGEAPKCKIGDQVGEQAGSCQTSLHTWSTPLDKSMRRAWWQK